MITANEAMIQFYTGTKGYEKLRKALESSGATIASGREISEKELIQLELDMTSKPDDGLTLWERVQKHNKGEVV